MNKFKKSINKFVDILENAQYKIEMFFLVCSLFVISGIIYVRDSVLSFFIKDKTNSI